MAAEMTHAPNSNQAMVREDEAKKLSKSIGEMIDKVAAKIASRGSVQLPAPSIFKVPDRIRKLKASAYTPRAVSIGPLHKDDERLRKVTEKHKQTYMHSLLQRTRRSNNTIAEDVVVYKCIDAMLRMVDEARACYEASDGFCYDNVNFAQMLILDGCFLLELFYKFKFKQQEFRDDPIFSNVLLHLDIIHDLVLLENQIPLFVLEALFECTLKRINGNDCPSLTTLILNFFERLNIFEAIQMTKKDTTTSNRHILGLLHSCYGLSSAPQENNNVDPHNIKKHTATELDRAGVKFVTGVGEDHLDLKFDTSCWFDWLSGTRAPSEIPTYNLLDGAVVSHGSVVREHLLIVTRSRRCCRFSWFCQLFGRSRFEIPKLLIFDTTENFLRNLIAFEQRCPDIEQMYITAYAYLMDTLVDSTEDVHLLENAGVIENNLGSSEDASNLFNNLCKEVALGKLFFFNQWKDVDDYYNRPWPRSLASLRRNYFSNPWSGISVIAALILFALTVVQTVYSFRSST